MKKRPHQKVENREYGNFFRRGRVVARRTEKKSQVGGVQRELQNKETQRTTFRIQDW